MSTELPAQPNQSLMNGLECLLAVAAAGRPVGGRELARQLDSEPTRVNRLLKTLAHLQVLERTADGKYRPGPGIHVLAALSLQGSHLVAAALPHARPWWEAGYAFTLGVLWRQHLCFLLRARPEAPFEQAVAGHEVVPAPQSSAGLVLLAHQPPEVVRGWAFEQGSRLLDPVAELDGQLARVRAGGYGVRHYSDGVASVGVPVGSPPIAALAASRPGLTEAEEAGLAARLRDTAGRILKDYDPGRS
jgi:DNA-binding IclR family transcriptional regulator